MQCWFSRALPPKDGHVKWCTQRYLLIASSKSWKASADWAWTLCSTSHPKTLEPHKASLGKRCPCGWDQTPGQAVWFTSHPQDSAREAPGVIPHHPTSVSAVAAQ